MATRPECDAHVWSITSGDKFCIKCGIPSALEQLQARADQLIKPKETVLGTQVGGDHYTRQKIQPVQYIWANNLGFSEGNVVKYVTRWKFKGGVKDLEKARHHLDLLIEEVKRDPGRKW